MPELDPHVTVCWGFDPAFDAGELAASLFGSKPINVTLGDVSRFDSHPDYDVLKVDCFSTELEELNAFLGKQFAESVTPSQRNYTPHLTLAYVSKGVCPELDGSRAFAGTHIVVDSLLYSLPGKTGRKTIALNGAAARIVAALQAAEAGHPFFGNQWTGGIWMKAADDYDALEKKANDTLPEFSKTLNDIAAKNNATVKLGKIKGGNRAIPKIVIDYKGDASKVKDMLRGTVVAQTPEQAHDVAQYIENNYDTSGGKARNRWAPGTKSLKGTGYRDAKYNVKIGGMVTELQVSTPEMLAAKKLAHPLMEKFQETGRKAFMEGRAPHAEEKATMRDLLHQQQAIYLAVKGPKEAKL